MNEGRAPKVGHMNYGTLSRVYCPNCLEETIHKRGKCVRTGCNHRMPYAPPQKAILPKSTRRGMENAQKANARKRGQRATSARHAAWAQKRMDIARVLHSNPGRTFVSIGDECGCSADMVSRVAAKMGILRA
jgi:hypothetical protein